jgi:hypothetical protein
MKLELKHLAPYLPYKLNGKLENEEYYETTIGELVRLDTATDSDSIAFCIVGGYEDELKYFKPILRPLSDLTKEIEVNGKKFIPIKETDIDIPFTSNYYFLVAYGDVEKLLQWHFDIFGLIEKCLAIDINSLQQSSE